MFSRITSNVTNFRVNIMKIERSHKKHYEIMFVAGRSLKKHHEKCTCECFNVTGARYRRHDVFLQISEHFNE
jgi:hypothetical protein